MLARALALLIDLSSAFGLFIVVTGGVRIKHSAYLPQLNLTTFGLWLLPLALCLVLDIRLPGSLALRASERLRTRLATQSRSKTLLFVAASITFLALGHLAVALLRHFTFVTGMDTAIYGNACRGALFSTTKGDVWLFADHFEPDLILFTPLCRLASSPAVVLLCAQTICYAIGALGMFQLALRCSWSQAQAWLLALAYLTFSPLVKADYYDFHLIVLSLGVVPWLWLALRAQRALWTVALFLLYLGLKESVSLTVVGLGIFLCFQSTPFEKRFGKVFIVTGAAVFILTMKVLYPLFRHGEETMYFAKYYGHLGNNLSEFVVTLVTRPLYVLQTLIVPAKLKYLATVFAPFFFFPVVRPLYFIPVAPALLLNVLSNDGNLITGNYHYEAEVYPQLFCLAVGVFKSTRLRHVWLAVLLVVFTHKSALSIARWGGPTKIHRTLLAQIEKYVPHGLAVAAPGRIAAHLTDRERLYEFDYWQMEDDWKRADIVVIGYMGPWMGYYSWDDFHQKILPTMLPGLKLRFQDPNDPRFVIYDVVKQQGAP